MRILFLEDDGLSRMVPYVRALGHEPVVLRSGAYDAWHANECQAPGLLVRRVSPQASALEVIDAALALEPQALVSLALLDPDCWRDALVGDFFRHAGAIPVVANPPATVLVANDKLRTKALLASHGIGVTEAIMVADLAQARAAAHELGYPLVLKRNDGYSGRGMRLIGDDAQLERYFMRAPSAVLVEHFTQGTELSVDVLRWNGCSKPLVVIDKGATDRDLRRHPMYRLRVAPAPLPEAVCQAALAVAARAMDLLGVVGLAECEMILHPERGLLVLEVNPRIAGTAALSAAASGIDLHRCLVDMALGRCDLARLEAVPACAVQIPVGKPMTDEALARLRGMPELRFVKHINWAPEIGISASLTVAHPDRAGLLSSLRAMSRLVDVEVGLAALAAMMATQ